MPAVAVRSFTPIGTPRKGASPEVESTLAAVARASSPQTVTNAFSVGSSRSMRSSESWTSSVDETSPERTSRACSTAETKASSTSANLLDNGEGRNRTGDTTVFSRVLYQLSYLAKAAQCSRASR